MNITSHQKQEQFEPVEIRLVFTSQEEVEAFGALCNVALCDIMRHNCANLINKEVLIDVQNKVFRTMQKYAKCIQIPF